MSGRAGRLVMGGWLALVWVLLWGSPSAANVLGGLAVATLLLLVLPLPPVPSPGIVRPGALLRFAGFFAVDLVRSSLQVAVIVLRPRLHLRQAVVAIPARGASDQLLTLLANAISLTPGTLTLEVDRPRSTLYVHVIDVGEGPGGVERVRQEILQVERLAILAVGSAECRRSLASAEEGTR
jgi:multicomponent Na+:H+ antiporter subunit E